MIKKNKIWYNKNKYNTIVKNFKNKKAYRISDRL